MALTTWGQLSFWLSSQPRYWAHPGLHVSARTNVFVAVSSFSWWVCTCQVAA